jgi:hypothetical protein
MAQYIVNPDKFVKISETSGYVYVSQGSGVEICTVNPVAGTGVVVLKSDNSAFPIHADNIYIRALREKTYVNCVATKPDSGGGSETDFATDQEVDEMLDEVFGDDTAEAGASEGESSGDGPEL